MKSYRKELWFNTKSRREFINITPQVQECLGAVSYTHLTLPTSDLV